MQWNDIEYMNKDLDFTYDNTSYDTLPGLVENLHSNHQKYVMIIDPGISNQQKPGSYPPYDEGVSMDVFVKQADSDEPLEGVVWPGKTVYPDFMSANSSAWWEKQLRRYREKVKFDGVWIDMNEPSNFVSGSTSGCDEKDRHENPPYLPRVAGGKLNDKTICMASRHYEDTIHYNVHNLYGYFEARATHKALLGMNPNKRPFIISRSTFAGSGVFGGHWTGDVRSTWDDLRQSVVGICNFNLFGIPLVGADICGFGGNTSPELCVRWTQLGAFYPFMRNHNTLDATAQAPTDFPSDVMKIMKKAIEMRYSFLPYLYTLFYEAHTHGYTVARGLYLEFPRDKTAKIIDSQFMWGDSLIISPVLQPSATSLWAYFPQSRWFDPETGDEVSSSSGVWKKFQVDLSTIKVHLRGGRVVPTQQVSMTTAQSRKNPFGLLVAMDERMMSGGSLFWDEGDGFTDEKVLIRFSANLKGMRSVLKESYGDFNAVLDEIKIYGLPVIPRIVTLTVPSLNVISKPVEFEVLQNNVLKLCKLRIDLTKEFYIDW